MAGEKERTTRLREVYPEISESPGVSERLEWNRREKDVPGRGECRISAGPPLPLPSKGAMPIASKLEEDPKRRFTVFLTVVRTVSEHSTLKVRKVLLTNKMKRAIVLTVLFVALSAGQMHRLSSSYKNSVKWEFGANNSHGDILARSVGQISAASSVYKNQPIVPIIRNEPVATIVYKKTSVPDVYQKKSVLPSVFKHEPVVHNIRKQQSAVFKTLSVASNIYKSESVVQNIYKQQAAVPIAHKEHSIVSNIYKNQSIRPVVHRQQQSLHRRVSSVDLNKKLERHVWNYQYDPHHLIVPANVHAVLHN
ncbi:uncharacterized protein LOC112639110 [Camponotus floridanus]|nr:uncharacterized protein LOC112639110 [Camponotus floridanus]